MMRKEMLVVFRAVVPKFTRKCGRKPLKNSRWSRFKLSIA